MENCAEIVVRNLVDNYGFNEDEIEVIESTDGIGKMYWLSYDVNDKTYTFTVYPGQDNYDDLASYINNFISEIKENDNTVTTEEKESITNLSTEKIIEMCNNVVTEDDMDKVLESIKNYNNELYTKCETYLKENMTSSPEEDAKLLVNMLELENEDAVEVTEVKEDIENVDNSLEIPSIKNDYPALLVALDSEREAEVTYKTLIEIEKNSETPNQEVINLLEKILTDELEHIALLSALQANKNAEFVADDAQEDFNKYIDDTVTEDAKEEIKEDFNDKDMEVIQTTIDKFYPQYQSVSEFINDVLMNKLPVTKVSDVEELINMTSEDNFYNMIDINATDISQGTGNVIVRTLLNPEDGKIYLYADY